MNKSTRFMRSKIEIVIDEDDEKEDEDDRSSANSLVTETVYSSCSSMANSARGSIKHEEEDPEPYETLLNVPAKKSKTL